MSKGGPIIAVQIENEYGSYGNDLKYKLFLKDVSYSSHILIHYFHCVLLPTMVCVFVADALSSYFRPPVYNSRSVYLHRLR